MRSFKKLMSFKVRSVLLLITAALLTISSANAQGKVGIVNIQKAVSDTQEIRKAQTVLEAKYKPRQEAINKLNQDLQTIQQQLSARNLTPEREADLNAQGARKQKELQRLSEDLQSDVNNERQDVLGRAGRQMQEIIRKIAEQKGLDAVLDTSTTLYFKPALDITAEVTAAYDKAYPPK